MFGSLKKVRTFASAIEKQTVVTQTSSLKDFK